MRIAVVAILLISITLSSAQKEISEIEKDSIDQSLQAISGEIPSQIRRMLDEMRKVSETENFVSFRYLCLLFVSHHSGFSRMRNG
jgi:hypothetical protein